VQWPDVVIARVMGRLSRSALLELEESVAAVTGQNQPGGRRL
jgi:hypothetical protein